MNNLQSSAFVAKTTQLLSSVAHLRLLLVMFLTLTASTVWADNLFNVTSYNSIPSGWTNNGVSTGSYFNFNTNGCYLTTPLYDPHTALKLTCNVATYGSGTNHALTIQLLDESGTVKLTHTTSMPTSSSYVSDTWNIGDINYKFKIKFYLAAAEKGVRLQVPKLVGTPPPSCSNQVTITKASAIGGSFKVRQGSASGTEISSGGTIDNCDANAVVVVVPTAYANYTCTGVNATNSNSISGADGSGNYTITYTKDSNISSTITVTFTENQKHSVTWSVDGKTLSTEDVYENGQVSSVPTVTKLPCGDKFVGWTKDPITTPQDNAPTVFTTVAGSPAITEPTTFYAVFADYVNE